MQRRAIAATAAAVVLWAALTIGAPIVSAHTDLVASDPAAGSELTASPTQVTLTFAGEPMALGATIIVVDADDQQWTDGDAVVSGTTVSAPLRPGAADGWYQVRWRIISADGDLVSGAFDYGVGDLTGKDPVRLSESGGTPTDGDFDIAPLEPLVTDDATTGAGGAAGDDAADTGTDVARLALVGVVGALAGAAAFAVGTVVSRRRSGAAPPHTEPTDTEPTDTEPAPDPTNSTTHRELTQ